MPIEAQEVAVRAGRAAGVPVSLDPHEEYVIGFERRLAGLLEGVAFMPSELEARLLFPDIAAKDGVAFGSAAAERLEAQGPMLVVIKLGAQGSVVRLDGRSVHVPAQAARVVDSTGAGDAYCGGFIAGWLATRQIEVAAACGTVAAGETIGSFGAFLPGAEPTSEERLARLAALLGDAGFDGFDSARAALRDQLGIGSPA